MSKKLNFGDFVRRELKDPESEISQSVRKFKAWTRLSKSEPQNFRIELYIGDIFFVKNGDWGADVSSHYTVGMLMKRWDKC